MLYLIGGSPRCGKSILSRKLSRESDIPYISTDNLRLVVLPYFKGKEKYKNFPFLKMFDVRSIDNFFRMYSGKEQLKADLKEAGSTWPGIESLIEHLLACKMDYIIEGIHLLPSLVSRFKGNRNVKVVFLTKVDEEKIFQGLSKNKDNSDWLMDNAKNKKTIMLAAEAMSGYGKYFVKEAEKHGYECFNTEDDFSGKINQAAGYLRNQII